MAETVSHTSITTSTQPFTLNGGIYNMVATGALAHGADMVELQQLSATGQPMQCNPPVRFGALDAGGAKMATLPAGTYRWKVPAGHNANFRITAQ